MNFLRPAKLNFLTNKTQEDSREVSMENINHQQQQEAQQQPQGDQQQHLYEQHLQQAMDMQRYNAYMMEQRRQERLPTTVRTYLETVKPYSGEKEDLVRFISAIEKIVPVMGKLDELETMLRFEQVLGKIVGEAKKILTEKPESWEDVRKLLIRSFSEKRDIGTLLLQLEQIQYQGSIQSTFSAIQRAMNMMLDKIELSPADPLKEERRGTVKQNSFRHFERLLSEPCRAALAGKDCHDIYTAMETLDQRGYLRDDHIANHSNFRSSGSRPQFKNNYTNRQGSFDRFGNLPNNYKQVDNRYDNRYDYYNNQGTSNYFARNTPQHFNNNPASNPRRPFDNDLGNTRQHPSRNNFHHNSQNQFSHNNTNNNNFGSNSGNSRQPLSRPNGSQNNNYNNRNYPDSGLQRVHEPMVHNCENFCTRASDSQEENYHSSASGERNS